jgi:hypothetical protein
MNVRQNKVKGFPNFNLIVVKTMEEAVKTIA